ncbi:MAG: tRNA sulfurtransferase [Candidatus Parvarchaeum sp.]
MKKILSVHYDEIALKGKQRGYFQSLLIKNINEKINKRIKAVESRLVLEDYNLDDINKLKLTPGVAWISEAYSIDRDEVELLELIDKIVGENKNVNIDVKRVDKGYNKTSLKLKEELAKNLKLRFDKNGKKIRIEIMNDSFIVNYSIERGIGGLPVGSSGKLLSLFSGGIDSAIAPLEMMKRGAKVDLLHVYALNSPDFALQSKIKTIAEKLSGIESGLTLYLVPFHYFSVAALKIDKRYELVLFKRFLLRLAEEISSERGYLAIVTGDALSQVASQTIENINAISFGIQLPVFRPFIGYNKGEIIEKSIRYGFYDISIEDYKDCCSIVSNNPATKSNPETIKKLENDIEMDKIIKDSLKELKTVKL